MIWPDWLADWFPVNITTFENIASVEHFVMGIVFALIAGCARPMLAGYTLYQFVTTLGKTLLFPEQHPWIDWTWDFFGDMVEILSAYGLVWSLGLAERVKPRGLLAVACSPRGVAALWGGLMVLWLVLLARTLAG